MKKILPYSIIVILVLLVLFNLSGIPLEFAQPYLDISILAISLLAIFIYRTEISSRFQEKFSKKEIIYSVLFVLILLLFLYIKLPYFENSLTEDRFIKYQESVEPALNMLHSGNLIEFKYNYLANPLNTAPIKTINHLPVYEYGLLLTYKLLPFNSLESNTHLFAFLIGCLFLLSVYLFSNTIFPKPFSTILVLILALSPIVNYSSFLIVGDTLMLSFLFFSLLSLQKYKEKPSNKLFFTASLLFALAILTKVSAVLIAIPLLLFFFLKDEKEKSKSGSKLIVFSILTVFIVAISLLFLRNFMSYFILSLLGLIIGLTIICLLSNKSSVLTNKIQQIIKKLNRNNITKSISWTILLAIIAYSYYYLYNNYLGGTLTNSFSIFNLEIYNKLIQDLISYLTPQVFFPALLGIVSLFVIKTDKKIKTILLAFLISSFTYWVLLSRILFFHDYYQLIIIFAFCLFFSYFVYSLSKIFQDKTSGIIFIVLFLLLLLPSSFQHSREVISPEAKEAKQAAEYLSSILNENQYFISGGTAQILSLYAQRNHVQLWDLKTDKIADEIKTKGFGKTLNELNITYFVTTNQQPEYIRIIALYDKNFQVDPDRDLIIKYLLGDKQTTYDAYEDRVMIVKLLELNKNFVPVKSIGKYNFFRIV